MKFGLVNESKRVTTEQCYAIDGALNTQARALAVAWDRVRPTCTFYHSLAQVPADHVPMIILDDPDVANALGYHDVAPDGRPYAKDFVAPILDNGGTVMSGSLSVSACFSHEFAEAFGDPSCLVWDDYDQTHQICHELCDPVQEDAYTLDTRYGPVTVSNFVLPAYFDPWNKTGPWDFMKTLTGPAPKLSKGGYAIVKNAAGEKQIFGEIPAWKQGLNGRSEQVLRA